MLEFHLSQKYALLKCIIFALGNVVFGHLNEVSGKVITVLWIHEMGERYCYGDHKNMQELLVC